MDILRFITAGSVDDGKSTLIGRLFYDSKSILVDQLEALEKQSKNKNADGIDLAILTDGLRAEREQGITIDVAYRYFSTPKRKFIIADAPGHVQYTRNMITGASNSQLIIILVDARNGVIEQTRRHSIIASLLKMKHVVVAVNKMDLADYSEEVFNKIKDDYSKAAATLGLENVNYIPISAFNGDNIVEKSDKMGWYNGPSLLEFLEDVEVSEDIDYENPRFQVQFVIRPQTEVFAHQPAVIHIYDDIDISRGDYFVKPDNLPEVENEFDAVVCWLDKKELNVGNKYFLQHKSRLVKAVIREIEYRIDVNTLEKTAVTDSVKLNEVVRVRIKDTIPRSV